MRRVFTLNLLTIFTSITFFINQAECRMYDPKTGRFLQRDPIGYYDSMNPYEYVHNDPINWIDPYGLLGEKEIKEELDKNFGDKLTDKQKKRISDFTGKYIGPFDVPGLMSKDPKKLKIIEDKVRKALEKSDEETKKAFEKLEELTKEKEANNKTCDPQDKQKGDKN